MHHCVLFPTLRFIDSSSVKKNAEELRKRGEERMAMAAVDAGKVAGKVATKAKKTLE